MNDLQSFVGCGPRSQIMAMYWLILECTRIDPKNKKSSSKTNLSIFQLLHSFVSKQLPQFHHKFGITLKDGICVPNITLFLKADYKSIRIRNLQTSLFYHLKNYFINYTIPIYNTPNMAISHFLFILSIH